MNNIVDYGALSRRRSNLRVGEELGNLAAFCGQKGA
jgi:hypothetical protein